MKPVYRICMACLGEGSKKTKNYELLCKFCGGTGRFPTEFFTLDDDPRALTIQLDDLDDLEQRMILQTDHNVVDSLNDEWEQKKKDVEEKTDTIEEPTKDTPIPRDILKDTMNHIYQLTKDSDIQ